MSEIEETTAATNEDGSDFQPITSQEALDKIIGQRIDGVKKKYAGFDELKAKASKFDEFQEASKSELQKVSERAQQLESELASERERAAKADVAAAKGVPVSALSGSTPDEWEAAADALLEWRAAQQVQEKPAKPVRGLKSGASSPDQTLDPKERAAAAIRAMRSQI